MARPPRLDLRDDSVGLIRPFAIIDRDRGAGFGKRSGNRRTDAARAPVTSATRVLKSCPFVIETSPDVEKRMRSYHRGSAGVETLMK